MYCLDTNIWSFLMRRPSDALVRHMRAHLRRDVCVSEMARAEMLYGAMQSTRPEALREHIESLLAPYRHLPFGPEAAVHYAEIRTELERRGEMIGPNDLIIAATVRAAGAVLVTHNLREFRRVPGLACEDWTE